MAKLKKIPNKYKKHIFIFLILIAISSCTQNKAYVKVVGLSFNKEISKSFPNEESCEESIKKCQNLANQVKPWLCGSCQKIN